MKLLTVEDIITSSGKYPERAQSSELNTELKANAADLVKRVNNLLQAIYKVDVKVSSGFRPSSVNSSTPNAAKRSLHMSCKAVDLEDDKNQTLGKLILANPHVLEDFGLWLEDLDSTKGKNTNWVHLDTGIRSPRKIRVFKP